ncbi:MAG: transcriptional regulator [Bacteroidales bacterium]|nr:transcriptional regulator [Bacteroidales bacterium]
MTNPIRQLNKAFDSRIRLGIMALLMVNEKMDFNTLKDTLELTDGNLASHLSALEQLEFIRVQKQFIGRKPNTTFFATVAGREAFKKHIDGLEQMLKTEL